MKVLTRTELKNLLKVKTSRKQAAQVLKRNATMLDDVMNDRNGVHEIGCPHCSSEYRCDRCAWNIPPFNNDKIGGRYCLNATFGGIDGVPDLVGLSHDKCHSYAADREYDNLPSSSRQEAIKWLLGHIEWTLTVLKKEGRQSGKSKSA